MSQLTLPIVLDRCCLTKSTSFRPEVRHPNPQPSYFTKKQWHTNNASYFTKKTMICSSLFLNAINHLWPYPNPNRLWLSCITHTTGNQDGNSIPSPSLPPKTLSHCSSKDETTGGTLVWTLWVFEKAAALMHPLPNQRHSQHHRPPGTTFLDPLFIFSVVTAWFSRSHLDMSSVCSHPISSKPSQKPTFKPTATPSSFAPSIAPSPHPTVEPSYIPSAIPSLLPTPQPSTATPTTTSPSLAPSLVPTLPPSTFPTTIPTTSPPSYTPTASPTRPGTTGFVIQVNDLNPSTEYPTFVLSILWSIICLSCNCCYCAVCLKNEGNFGCPNPGGEYSNTKYSNSNKKKSPIAASDHSVRIWEWLQGNSIPLLLVSLFMYSCISSSTHWCTTIHRCLLLTNHQAALLATLAITNPNDSFVITITSVIPVTTGSSDVKVYYTITSNSPQLTPSDLEATLTQSSTTAAINTLLQSNGGSQYANVQLSVPTVIMVTNAPSFAPTTTPPTYSPTGSSQPTINTPTPSQTPSPSSAPSNTYSPTFNPTVAVVVADTNPGPINSGSRGNKYNIALIVALMGGLLLLPWF